MSTHTFSVATTAGSSSLSGTLTVVVPDPPDPPKPTPPPAPALLGVDCADKDVAETNRLFPASRYHRIFPGKAGTLPSLTDKTGKLFTLPAHTVRHVSWDVFDLTALKTWLEKAPTVLPAETVLWLSLNHEIDRPDKAIDPVKYRPQLAEVVKACQGHPLVRRVSVILTGYDLDERGSDPRRYLVDGAELDADRYNQREVLYRTPEQLFDPLIAAAEKADRHRMAIPEFGAERITGDDGEKRAAWLRACYAYIGTTDISAVGWWGIGGCKLTAHPELATMQTLVAVQG